MRQPPTLRPSNSSSPRISAPRIWAAAAALAIALTVSLHAQDHTEVQFRSLDGLAITADLYEVGDRNAPLVIAFHQSGSSRGEYRQLSYIFTNLGLNLLAVDLRWGGLADRWSSTPNETAARYGIADILGEVRSGNRERVWPTIFKSYEDMLASFDWATAQGFNGPHLAIGSSFSAMLVLRLPTDRRVDGVIAFSPGEYFPGDSALARAWVAEYDVPLYVAAAPDERELSGPVFDAAGSRDKVFHVVEGGTHGASMLAEDSAGVEHLSRFLRRWTPDEFSFMTDGGTRVFGDRYRSVAHQPTGTILLFHQAGSSARGEYGTIIPRLIALGFDTYAFDLPGGGDRFGIPNRTVAGLRDRQFTYCEAYQPMSAALGFVESQTPSQPLIVLGSSYSAGLALKLAHEYRDLLSRTIAFSPASGGPMEECDPNAYLRMATSPLLVVRPPLELQYESVRSQFDLADSLGHQTLVPFNGVHGASMLDPHRVHGSIDDTWAAVTQFILGSTNAPASQLGIFLDDYGERYHIDDSRWRGPGDIEMEIVSWNSGEHFAIARNDPDDRERGDAWTRIDFVPLEGMEPYTWAYCFSDYESPSPRAALNATPADRTNPRTGCDGFPFTRMSQIPAEPPNANR